MTMMEKFPVVAVSGSHYEVGLAIGETMRSPIQDLVNENSQKLGRKKEDAIKQSDLHLAYAKKHFPQYLRELDGIADGAGVWRKDVYLTNNRETGPFNADDEVEHCTIVAIPIQGGYLFGHNEDWEPEAQKQLYILDATVEGVRIFGLNYAHALVGVSVAINGYGLIQGVNELSHKDSQIGIPKNFIARAILDCRTLEEAARIFALPRAGGYNHLLVQGNRLMNIESSAAEHDIHRATSQKYVHTNTYLAGDLKHLDLGSKESRTRYQKVQNLLSSTETIDDMKMLLSDRDNPPICRAGTIGSVIVDANAGIVYAAYGQPTPESYYQMRY